MSLVLDNSVTIAWLTANEKTFEVEKVFEQIGEQGACAPPIWLLEVANVLRIQEKHAIISREVRTQHIDRLDKLDIFIDMDSFDYVWNTTVHLADAFNLTIYDACYIELSLRKLLPLATLDKKMRSAAAALNIPLLGL